MSRDSPKILEGRPSAGKGRISNNHLELLHTQDLMGVIKTTAREMAHEKDKVKVMKLICDKAGITHPVLKAIVLAILKGTYEIKDDPKVRDAKLWWIGPNWQNVAKVAHKLTTPNLYHVVCRVHKSRDCPGKIPPLVIRAELPREREWYEDRATEEVFKTYQIYFTIECGQMRLVEAESGRELTLDMLLK